MITITAAKDYLKLVVLEEMTTKWRQNDEIANDFKEFKVEVDDKAIHSFFVIFWCVIIHFLPNSLPLAGNDDSVKSRFN